MASKKAGIVAGLAVAGLAAAWLGNELAEGRPLPRLAPWFLQENKWRAARYGMDAEIVTMDPLRRVQPLRDRMLYWLNRFEPFARKLGCADELAFCATLAHEGPSYARQRATAASGDLRAVVRQLVDETGAVAPRGLGG